METCGGNDMSHTGKSGRQGHSPEVLEETVVTGATAALTKPSSATVYPRTSAEDKEDSEEECVESTSLESGARPSSFLQKEVNHSEQSLSKESSRDDLGSSRGESETPRQTASPGRVVFGQRVAEPPERPVEVDFHPSGTSNHSPGIVTVSPTFSADSEESERSESSSLISPSSSSDTENTRSAGTCDSLPEREVVHSEALLERPYVRSTIDEVVEEEEETLERLENVTALSRSLIPAELLQEPKGRKRFRNRMATAATSTGESSRGRKGFFSKRLSLSRRRNLEANDEPITQNGAPREHMRQERTDDGEAPRPPRMDHQGSSIDDDASRASAATEEVETKSRRGVLERLRARSRSRSRSASRSVKSGDGVETPKPVLVAVTSCRSDAYYNQKAPGSTSKLPRKAPTNLKLFHELAVGIKDAYAAVGQTPTRPDTEEQENQESPKPTEIEMEGRTVLWEFVGNLDFLLALVDEVAIDTATRGALKDDTTFKSLRDVIKKCNKVLEGMLVRRERRYTLFFRLVQAHEVKEIAKIKSWNSKVEKAVGAVADTPSDVETDAESESENESVASSKTDVSSGSTRAGMFSRGRQLLPTAGRVRARRATPTPTLRNRRRDKSNDSQNNASSAEDGYSAVTTPVATASLGMLQRSIVADNEGESKGVIPPTLNDPAVETLGPVKPMEPKDELIDVIRGLRTEKIQKREGTAESDLATLKPNWQPKADIPSSVPKLPTEYIHRHRLMKQVVNCLLDIPAAGAREAEDDAPKNTIITAITSRHADKPGNGKTTLAVAAIQTVEVRERFSDGIAWIQLGRNPLTEKEVRRLYEELFRQLVSKDDDSEEGQSDDDASKERNEGGGMSRTSSSESVNNLEKEAQEHAVRLAESRQRFQGGELDAIKEDLARIITKRKVLICLDDVWRVDDAKWFIFDTLRGSSIRRQSAFQRDDEFPYRILITTRTPALLGQGVVHEVFVRIFSEHEAVKLLLSSAGRRPYGGKQSAVFNQARIIVKGCGNSPMAVRLAGGMLRRSNRNWNLSSPTWLSLIHQSRLNLEEASRLRSFINSVTRVVDLGFATIEDMDSRVALRRCFIFFAMAFRDNDWVQVGKGIPQAVVLKVFAAALNHGKTEGNLSPLTILRGLERMNLLERARHGYTANSSRYAEEEKEEAKEEDVGNADGDQERSTPRKSAFIDNPSFVMQDALRAIGEDMAKREAPSFLSDVDKFISFEQEIVAEQKYHDSKRGLLSGAMRFLAKHLSSSDGDAGLQEIDVHEMVAACLVGVDGRVASMPIADAFARSRVETDSIPGGSNLEEYLSVFLPSHLVRCHAYTSAGALLVSPNFIRRRVHSLGVAEATRKQVTDLLDLRREVAKCPSTVTKSKREGRSGQTTDDADTQPTKGTASPPSISRNNSEDTHTENSAVDTSLALREGCRTIVDEVHRMVSTSKGSAESLSMAICLSTVGEALLKGKQPRDAMLRLEEAVIIYRGILGQNHVDVARSLHSVARALVKLGENRVALHKFVEAAQIYESCNATMHYDSIANTQNLATLLIDLGEWDQAAKHFSDVISKKKAVYGEGSVSVAKTINSYAILLAKHGRMDEALANYEAARRTYEDVPTSLLQDPEFDIKCRYDVTLINLNIASIRSKKGDLQGAILSYEEGVQGLRQYEAAQETLQKPNGGADLGKNTSHTKHLVAALGRIGSLKLKIGDNSGALEAYQALLSEVDSSSPSASQIEKAKAHIKCATIYRQDDAKNSHLKSISHLREALEMYTNLFGPEHKDTLAIAASLRQWLAEEPQNDSF